MASLVFLCDCRGASVQGKVGCLPDDTNPGTYFCYVVDPLGCPVASQSVVYQGAGYRTCEPTLEANATSFNSVLDVLATVLLLCRASHVGIVL